MSYPEKINLTQIMESIVTRISSTMHIDRVAVTLWNKFECVCYSKNIDNSLCKFSNSSDGIYSFFKKNKKPQIFDYLSEEFEQLNINKNDKQKIIDANIILIVPMFFKDNLVGIISVGEKLSGKIYSQEDIDLLITVANQAAIAIENARLYESEFEKKKIQQELNLARKIQQGLLPQKMPFFNGVEISAISQPAELVGGDYYDLIQVDDNKLFVIVADVSGKGISAALYMSKIQGIMQLATRMYSNPKDILIEVNKQIYEGIERKSFVTMIVALFDFQEKTVTICRAGHNKPIVSIDNDVKLLDSTGIGLGLEKGNIFNTNLKESKLELGKDNLFVFYSDGLTETMNDKYEEYGESNLLNFIKNNLSLSPEELKISLLEEIYSFRNLLEPHDDLTLVIIKYKQ
jgi:serine phosphatase RsbU (regulator of sigma subunit)